MLGRLTMLLLAALLLTACAGDEGDATTTTDRDVPAANGDAPSDEPIESGQPGQGGDSGGARVPVEEQAGATLRVELRNIGAKDGAGIPVPDGITCTRSLPATCRETIECPVAADGDPADQRVCAWLQDSGRELLLEEPEAGRVCTQVYGGPEVATVTGTIDGKPVAANFSREDGCAIARFDAVSPLWTGVVDPKQPVDGAASPAEPQPRIVEDPPEAFDLERDG